MVCYTYSLVPSLELRVAASLAQLLRDGYPRILAQAAGKGDSQPAAVAMATDRGREHGFHVTSWHFLPERLAFVKPQVAGSLMSTPKASGQRVAYPIAIIIALTVLSWAVVVSSIAAIWSVL